MASALREPWSTMTTAVRSQSEGGGGGEGSALAADAANAGGIRSKERRSLRFVSRGRAGRIGALALLLLQEARAL